MGAGVPPVGVPGVLVGGGPAGIPPGGLVVVLAPVGGVEGELVEAGEGEVHAVELPGVIDGGGTEGGFAEGERVADASGAGGFLGIEVPEGGRLEGGHEGDATVIDGGPEGGGFEGGGPEGELEGAVPEGGGPEGGGLEGGGLEGGGPEGGGLEGGGLEGGGPEGGPAGARGDKGG